MTTRRQWHAKGLKRPPPKAPECPRQTISEWLRDPRPSPLWGALDELDRSIRARMADPTDPMGKQRSRVTYEFK